MYQTFNVTLARFCSNLNLILFALCLYIGSFTYFGASMFSKMPMKPESIVLATFNCVVGCVLSFIVVRSTSTETRNIIQRSLVGKFPLTIDKFWYSGAWYQNDKRDVILGKDNIPLFNPLKVGFNGGNTDHLIMGLIPAFAIGREVGLYRVNRRYHDPKSGDCRTAWDDGKLVDLSLMAIFGKEEAIELIKANEQLTTLAAEVKGAIGK